MQFRLELITDNAVEAALWMQRLGTGALMDALPETVARQIIAAPSTAAPTEHEESPAPAPTAEAPKSAKRGPGRPPKPKPDAPVADSKDPAQLDLTKSTPSPEAQGGVSTGVVTPNLNGAAAQALPIPSLDDVKVLMDRYRDKFGLAALKTQLVEAGVNRFTELGDALPAFYAARMAEVAA